MTAFRRAVVTNHQEPESVLALAGALARQHQNDAVRASLLALRESAPEHPEVNLQLARPAASPNGHRRSGAVYHSTLYAPWPREEDKRRRQVRLELIDSFLRHGQTESGISELVALSTDVPNRASSADLSRCCSARRSSAAGACFAVYPHRRRFAASCRWAWSSARYRPCAAGHGRGLRVGRPGAERRAAPEHHGAALRAEAGHASSRTRRATPAASSRRVSTSARWRAARSGRSCTAWRPFPPPSLAPTRWSAWARCSRGSFARR